MINLPLSKYIPTEYLPEFFKNLVNNIIFIEEVFIPAEYGWNLNLRLGLANGDNINSLTFPSIDSPLAVSFQGLNTLSIIKIVDDYALRYNPAQVSVLLPSFLKNATVQDNKLIAANTGRASIDIELQDKYVEYNTFNGVNFIGPDLTSFKPQINTAFLIGDTGIGFSLTDLLFDLNSEGVDIHIKQARVYFPETLGSIPNIEINNGLINQNGFTGELKFDWVLRLDNSDPENKFYTMSREGSAPHPVKLFGDFTGGLYFFAVTFENNTIKACTITGEMLIPYFDGQQNAAVRLSITLDDAGNFSVVATGASGTEITLTKDELLKLHVQSLAISKLNDVFSVSLSGGLEPMLYSSEGVKWPRMDIKNLKLDSTGKFSIDEAWLDLKDMATLDLFGFHMELRKIGLGTLADKLWIDLSGAVKLIEQIPIGVDVEGFRLIWPQDTSQIPLGELSGNIGIQFKGVQLSFGVPGAIQLDGLIRFFKDNQTTGFAGDMVLVIPPAGMTAEAGLLVGMNAAEPNPYAFFYVYFGLECAAGIPLGQSGLALKGALGLFGINVAPDKSPEENWYYDWFKRAPAPGAHQTTKWTNQKDSLAVGAGLTITTVDGIMKGTRGIIVLALPGPILVINGKALILNGLNPDPAAEPPFSATAIFDGKEQIVQFNVEAQAEIVEDMVDAHAGVEAFFDFKDVTNWHLYLGQDEPYDRRVRANILNVIEADAYLMLDMLDTDSLRSRMGVDVSVKPKIDSVSIDVPFVDDADDPEIKFSAQLDLGGKGVVSMTPEQFSGNAYIDAGITISALGFEVEVGAKADLQVEGPSPFLLEADLALKADLPDPLPDYDDEFTYKLEIPAVDLTITRPLSVVSLFSRFTSESKGAPVYDDNVLDDELVSGNVHVPVVNCDINPILTFEHEMNTDCSFVMHPNGAKSYDVGILKFIPELTSVKIEEKKKSGGGWTTIYNTTNNTLPGVWLAESDPGSPLVPASRRLQLLTYNPLGNTVHSTAMQGYLMMQQEAADKHLSEKILEDYPDLMFCPDTKAQEICIDFRYSGKKIRQRSIVWAGIEFRHASEDITIDSNTSCLISKTDLEISFPRSVVSVTLEFCSKPDKLSVATFAKPKGKALAEILRKAKEKKMSPELTCSISIPNTIQGDGNIYKIFFSKNAMDCLSIRSDSKEGIQVKNICYVTEDAEKKVLVNKKICERNDKILGSVGNSASADMIRDNNLFKPGCYYKITVDTKVKGEIQNLPGKEFLIPLYEAAIGSLEKSFTSYSYFQTETPPENINPYIKWSTHEHQGKDVYINDPIFIRFKREYIQAIFGNNSLQDFQLGVVIKNSMGEIIHATLEWMLADAYTLFPDEETWVNHLLSEYPQRSNKKDTILKATIRDQKYKVNGRYELIILGRSLLSASSKDSNVLQLGGAFFRILSSATFTASKFSSFGSMIKSGCDDGNNLKMTVTKGNVIDFGSSFDTLVENWANAEIGFFKTSRDYQYGIAVYKNGDEVLVSKEALEKTRLLLREAKGKIDDEFNSLAMAINTDLLFADTDGKTRIFAITDAANSKIEFLWIKFPEVLLLKKGRNNATIGNTSVEVKLRDEALISRMIFNADSSQIIIKPERAVLLENIADIKIKVTMDKDYRDDISAEIFGNVSNNHHRYDRVSFKGMESEVVELIVKTPGS